MSIQSAFLSAGAALLGAARILCLQDVIADHVLTMLAGAMNELKIGDPGTAGDGHRAGH